jgi:hypothetical protein
MLDPYDFRRPNLEQCSHGHADERADAGQCGNRRRKDGRNRGRTFDQIRNLGQLTERHMPMLAAGCVRQLNAEWSAA